MSLCAAWAFQGRHRRVLATRRAVSGHSSLLGDGERLAALPLHHLDGQVAHHADTEHDQQDVHLDVHAEHIRVDEGDGEAERLPEPVVAEGRLRGVWEDDAVEGVDLRLPDGVGDAPCGG